MSLTLKEYQEQAHTTACYKGEWYPILALQEEVGELSGKLAKAQRGDYSIISDDLVPIDGQKVIYISDIKKEIGDILWQLNEFCTQHGWSMEEIARMNLDKLKSRFNRNLIQGNGDNR